MAESITIDIPGSPPIALSPNRIGGTKWRAKPTKRMRTDAAYAARAVVGPITEPLFSGPVELHIHVGWQRGQRSTDLDAIPLMTKSYQDGALVDGMIVRDDRQIKRLVTTSERDQTGRGFVRLTVTAMEG